LTSISELTFFGTPVMHFTELKSTNEYLKNQSISCPMLVVADSQSHGKGQYGKDWHSEPNQNLTFSFQWFPKNLRAEEGFKLSQMVSLAILKTVNKYIDPERAYIKWPNDIVIENKKVCGVLIEPTIQNNLIQKVIVGIGLNVNQTQFPPNLPNASSLSILFPEKHWEVKTILQNMMASFESLVPRLPDIETQSKYNSNMLNINDIITISKADKFLSCLNMGVNKEGFWVLKNLSNEEILTLSSSREIDYVY